MCIRDRYWTLELASKLEDAPWPATKDELIDYAMRSGAPLEAVSYTHLDVYKRQVLYDMTRTGMWFPEE